MKREEVIGYEIYVQSFYDSNDDGIGDLNGIISKLNYLNDLGVNLLWLTPIYLSPLKDNGYDVSNYKMINPIYGTMDDFDKLVIEANKLGIEIMLDLVLNHSSIEHRFFKEALKGNKKYIDYYFFRDGKTNNQPPTNWISKFGGSAWKYVPNIDKWYLHLFDESQADFNWDNPRVREELFSIVNFWATKGVTGFRFDVINLISKPKLFLDSKVFDGKEFYTDGPNVHKYINYLNRKTFGKSQKFITVGEMSSTTVKNSIKYSHFGRNELSMVFTFHHLKVDYRNNQKWVSPISNNEGLKTIITKWITEIDKGGGWLANFLSNHDQPRHISRFGDDKKYHYQSATSLALFYIFLKGTPYIFNGEEIGMPNANRKNLNQFKDIESLNAIVKLRANGHSEDEILEIVNYFSRDNGRLPMYWNNRKNAGFSTVSPWIEPSDSYKKINVEIQINDPNSIYSFYKKIINFRLTNMSIMSGTIEFIELGEGVVSYTRKYDQKTNQVIVNLTDQIIKIDLHNYHWNTIINNYEIFDGETLLPYQGIVLEK